jgi:hypothetical protein
MQEQKVMDCPTQMTAIGGHVALIPVFLSDATSARG